MQRKHVNMIRSHGHECHFVRGVIRGHSTVAPPIVNIQPIRAFLPAFQSMSSNAKAVTLEELQKGGGGSFTIKPAVTERLKLFIRNQILGTSSTMERATSIWTMTIPTATGVHLDTYSHCRDVTVVQPVAFYNRDVYSMLYKNTVLVYLLTWEPRSDKKGTKN